MATNDSEAHLVGGKAQWLVPAKAAQVDAAVRGAVHTRPPWAFNRLYTACVAFITKMHHIV